MKTAVEWLGEELHNFIHPEHGRDFIPILQKAIEMEKQQIINSYVFAGGTNTNELEEEAEQYYNETFKTKKNEIHN